MKTFKCSVTSCGLEFKNSKRLSEHKKRKHTASHEILDGSFLCEVCGYCTRFSFNLRTHIRTHNGEKPYCCDECGNLFASLTQLNEHRKVHRHTSKTENGHTQERFYNCAVCKASFYSSKALYHHKKLHLKDKSYECCFCDSKFAQAAGFSQHMRQQHKLKDNKGFPNKITIEKLE